MFDCLQSANCYNCIRVACIITHLYHINIIRIMYIYVDAFELSNCTKQEPIGYYLSYLSMMIDCKAFSAIIKYKILDWFHPAYRQINWANWKLNAFSFKNALRHNPYLFPIQWHTYIGYLDSVPITIILFLLS